ncbi:Putative pentatricopeptide repeat-containing protein At1g12700, mitochondrial [Linum grandiflorum]
MERSSYVPNKCSYNVIIRGFLRHKDPLDAKELIQEMVSEGFQADAATMSLMIELLPKKQLDHPVLRKLLSDSYAVSEEFRPKGLSPDTTSKD